MRVNQHFPQNFSKIRQNKTPEYEANIILLENEWKINILKSLKINQESFWVQKICPGISS
jgi:hypothetical protein